MATIRAKRKELSIARIRKGLSIRCLAEKAGLNPSTIWKTEGGNVSSNPATAKAICDILCAEFDELFEIIENDIKP